MRSVYSDPIASGIDAFSKVSDTLQRIDTAPIRKQLLQEEVRDREQNRALKQVQEERQRKADAREDEMWERQKDSFFDQDTEKAFKVADSKVKSGQELDDSDIKAVLTVANRSKFGRKNVGEIDDMIKSARGVKAFIDKASPVIQQKIANKEGVTIDRTQYPEEFENLEKIFGDEINRGADSTGQEAKEKKLQSISIGPDGRMAFNLRVVGSDGKEYYSPMTVDRGNDPKAPVLMMPVGVFNAAIGSYTKMGDYLDAIHMQLGDKEFEKKMSSHYETSRKSQAVGAGQVSVDNLLKKNPKASVNELRNAFKEGANKIGTLDPKELSQEARDYVQEREHKNSTEASLALEATEDTPEGRKAKKALGIIAQTDQAKKREPVAPKDKMALDRDPEGNLIRVDLTSGTAKKVTYEGTGQLVKAQPKGNVKPTEEEKQKKKLNDEKIDRMRIFFEGSKYKGTKEISPERALEKLRETGWTDADIIKYSKAAGHDLTSLVEKSPQQEKEKPTGKGYGKREDGTEKGDGFFGPLKMKDGSGKVMSELSISTEINGKEVLMPSMVPTLTKKEVDYLLSGGNPLKDKSIMDKAVEHMKKRRAEGKSPFADKSEEGKFKPGSGEQKQKAMDTKPPASEHKDRIIKDTKTGKRYKSDGKDWLEIK